MLYHPTPFPTERLPPSLRAVVEEVSQRLQTPVALVWSVLVCALAAAYQDKFNVLRDTDYLVPLHMSVGVIAESGVGKSPAEAMLFQPYQALEADAAVEDEYSRFKWKAEETLWKQKIKVLKSQMAQALKDGEDPYDLKEDLVLLLQEQPIQPKELKMLIKDATPAATLIALDNYPSILYAGAEGGIIKPLLSSAAVMNLIADGTDYQRNRASSRNFVIRNPRLTISLQIQPKTFQRILDRQGMLGRDNGMWARFLFCSVPNPAGYKVYDMEPKGPMPHLRKFQSHLLEVLKDGLARRNTDTLEFQTIKLSSDARLADVKFLNHLQQLMRPYGFYADYKDAATKLSAIACKLAALFHCFEQKTGPISGELYEGAGAICEWHLHEFKQLFSKEDVIPPEIRDSRAVSEFLVSWATRHQVAYIQKGQLLEFGPNHLRSARGMNAVLSVLEENRMIYSFRNRKAQYVIPNPVCFNSLPPLGYWPLPQGCRVQDLTGSGIKLNT